MKTVKVFIALFAAVIMLNMQATPTEAHSHHGFNDSNYNFNFTSENFWMDSHINYKHLDDTLYRMPDEITGANHKPKTEYHWRCRYCGEDSWNHNEYGANYSNGCRASKDKKHSWVLVEKRTY